VFIKKKGTMTWFLIVLTMTFSPNDFLLASTLSSDSEEQCYDSSESVTFSTVEEAQSACVLAELPEDSTAYCASEIIVVFGKSSPSNDDIDTLISGITDLSEKETDCFVDLIGRSDDQSIAIVSIPDDVDVIDAMVEAANNDVVVFVQPNFVYQFIDPETIDEPAFRESLVAGVSPLASTNDPELSNQWWLQVVHADEAWDFIPASTTPVTIAVVDSGARLTHQDLFDQLAKSSSGEILAWDAIEQVPLVQSSIYSLYNGDQGGSLAGHGTHVSGIAVAEGNNGVAIAGVSGNRVRLLPIRVFESAGTSTSAWLISAYDYVMEHAAETNTRVINLSLGSYNEVDFDPLFRQKIIEARNKGIVTVCAGGNGQGGIGVTVPIYPSDWPEVLSVTAVDINSDHAIYSDFNSLKDISAPGGAGSQTIVSLSYSSDSGVLYKRGSSMACAVVSGTIAMLFSVKPEMTPDQVINLVCSTAQDQVGGAFDTPGRDDYFGHGVLNAKDAVLRTMSLTPAANPIISSQPMEASYAMGVSPSPLSVAAASPDGGMLSFQWFYSNNENATTPSIISGATSQDFIPPTNASGERYYFCLVTNTRLGSVPETASIQTSIARICVLTNAFHNKVVIIATALDPSRHKIIDIYRELRDDGTRAIIYDNHITPNQRFRMVQDSDGYYRFINVNSGKVLDINNNQDAEGTPIIQYSNHGGANQRWSLARKRQIPAA